MADSTLRRDVHFRGRVQGVGFRATVCGLARHYKVVGYVQNLPDGRVRMTAEGAADELTQFVLAIASEMDRYLDGYEVDESPATGEFTGFSIRH